MKYIKQPKKIVTYPVVWKLNKLSNNKITMNIDQTINLNTCSSNEFKGFTIEYKQQFKDKYVKNNKLNGIKNIVSWEIVLYIFAYIYLSMYIYIHKYLYL